MNDRGVSMKRFAMAMMLSVLMLFTSVVNPVFAESVKASGKTTSSAQKNPKEKITLLVALKERKKEARTGISSVAAEDLNTENHIRAQVAYAKAARETFYQALKAEKIAYKVTETYDVAYTGLAMEVSRGDVDRIKAMADVQSVEESVPFKAPKRPMTRSAFHTMDISSNKMVEADQAWSSKYDGKGSLIAIIDSGVDPSHEAMKLTDAESGRIKGKAQTESLIKDLNIARGKYFSSKIPFGYNYANQSVDIKENSPMSHGMHVAGIAAGNGGKIKGVAPEAQIAFMRVFGGGMFGQGTTPEIYTKAIDDAIKLGVDSMNVSLGSPAGSEDWVFPNTVRALENAKKSGILVSVAAGNSGFFGYYPGRKTLPKAENPDVGMLSDPAVSPDSFAVASIQNMKTASKGITIEGVENKVINYQPSEGSVMPATSVKIKDCGWGRLEDFKVDGDKDTYALVERGEPNVADQKQIPFIEKIRNAEQKGYAGVLVYDNEEGDPFIMQTPGKHIPAALISKSDGAFLKQHLDKKIVFHDDYVFADQKDGGEPSEFSSWGMTPQGNLKPDIAAPGGQIFSSLNDNKYMVMDGTSMAAPHVAGGIALVKQRVEQEFSEYRGKAKYDLIKKLMMSTAEPVIYRGVNNYASPRQQGSGLMKIDRALKAMAYIEGSHGLTSINLKNLQGDTVTVPFKIVNLSDKAKTYKVHGVLNTDKVENGKMVLRPERVSASQEQTVTVAAKAEQSLTVTLPIQNKEKLQEKMPKGFFLEGFVFCKEEGGVDLSAPFVGFYGSFDQLEVAERPLYDLVKEGKRSNFYEMGADIDYYGTYIGGNINQVGIVLGAQANSTKANPNFDKSKIAFSPNGDGRIDKAIFMATFLRNWGGLEMEITDSTGQRVYYSNNAEDRGVKNFPIEGANLNNMMTTKLHWMWDGMKLDGKPAPDGQYEMTVKTWAAGQTLGPNAQTMKFPLTVDRVFPRVTKAYFSEENKKYTIESIDEDGSGILSVQLKNGTKTIEPANEGDKYIFDISGLDIKNTEVEVSDQARNLVTYPLESGVRNGDERSVRVTASVIGESVPKEAYRWRVETTDGKRVDPNNLNVGQYRLVVDIVDPMYKLIGESTIPFEMKEEDREKVIPLDFEMLKTSELRLSLDNPYNVKPSFVVINKKSKQEFVPNRIDDRIYTLNLPVGEYTIDVRGLPEEYYLKVKDGQDFVVDSSFMITKNIEIRKIFNKEITLNVDRDGYKGALTVKLTGQDSRREVQKVTFNSEESKKTVRLNFIPSDIDVLFLEDPYYGLSQNTKIWTAYGTATTLDVDLEQLTFRNPTFIDRSKLRALRKEAESIDLKNYALENEDDRRAHDYFNHMLVIVDQALINENNTQDEIDKIYNNFLVGIGNLRKKGTSIHRHEALNQVIDRVEKMDLTIYTDQTKAAVEQALEKAKRIRDMKDDEKTQLEIDQAAESLNQAVDQLVRTDGQPNVDKSKLEAAIEAFKTGKYKEDRAQYTLESYRRLLNAVNAGKQLMKRDFPSQEEVEAATLEITEAIKGLSKIKGKEDLEKARIALKEEIERSEGLKKEEYTDQSWKVFEDALQEAKACVDNAYIDQTKLELCTYNLKGAREALKPRAKESEIKREFFSLPFKVLMASKELDSMLDQACIKPAQLIKETASDGTINYKVALRFKELEFAGIKGRMLEVLTASDLQNGYGAMPLVDPIKDGEHLDGITISMGSVIKPKHYLQVKYRAGEVHTDWTRIVYDEETIKSIVDQQIPDGKIEALNKAKAAAKETIEALKNLGSEKQTYLAQVEQAQTMDVINEIVAAAKAKDAENKKSDAEQQPQPSPEPSPSPTPNPKEEPKVDPNKDIGKGNKYVPRPDTWPKVYPMGSSDKQTSKEEPKKEAPKKQTQGDKKFSVQLPATAFVKGFPDGTFKPDKGVTRAEVSRVLDQFIQSSIDAKVTAKDVRPDAWYAKNMSRLNALGIMTGYDNGTLRPEATMTRAELATLMCRILELKMENPRFTDVNASDWYAGYAGAVQKAGIIQGYPDGGFGGNKTVTRAELISIVNRAFGVKDKGVETIFSDLPKTHWAYKEIQKAAN